MSSVPDCPVLVPVVIKSTHLSPSHLLLFSSKAQSQLLGSSAPPYRMCAHTATHTVVQTHTDAAMYIHIFTTTQHMYMNTCPHMWVLTHVHRCGYLEVCRLCTHSHTCTCVTVHTCKHARTALHTRNCRLSAGNLSSSEETLLVRQ